MLHFVTLPVKRPVTKLAGSGGMRQVDRAEFAISIPVQKIRVPVFRHAVERHFEVLCSPTIVKETTPSWSASASKP